MTTTVGMMIASCLYLIFDCLLCTWRSNSIQRWKVRPNQLFNYLCTFYCTDSLTQYIMKKMNFTEGDGTNEYVEEKQQDDADTEDDWEQEEEDGVDDATGVVHGNEGDEEGEEGETDSGKAKQEQKQGDQGEKEEATLGDEKKDDSGDKYHVPSHGEQRIADSLTALDNKKSKGIEHTTAVRVNADEAENKRRIEEEERRQDRVWRLQEEAVGSGKANAAVEMKWNDLKEYNMPQELNDELEAQKEACARIIASKNQLIQEFKVILGSLSFDSHIRKCYTQ